MASKPHLTPLPQSPSIAIVGTGPTGLYSFAQLIQAPQLQSISLFEQGAEAGVGMPYNDHANMRLMLANIASIEIPPLTETYLHWLQRQSAARLSKFSVDKQTLHERQFLPRILLGEYFRDQFLALVDQGRAAGHIIHIYENCRVQDIDANERGCRIWAEGLHSPMPFDRVIIATGHIWPDEDQADGDHKADTHYFPSPWSGLLEAEIPPTSIGIMGTSLSAIDAAMAVAAQHGRFVEQELPPEDAAHPHPSSPVSFQLFEGSEALHITLMSRSGILPEADFHCPIPYEPLNIVTEKALAENVAMGSFGLLDRIFDLMRTELYLADADWALRIGLSDLTADSFADAYFADRKRYGAFSWAAYNLREVEENKARAHTVPWRYAILRMHEAVQETVSDLSEEDRERFDSGLSRVFVDNYAAIPSESIRRLLALRAAAMIETLELGSDYEMDVAEDRCTITAHDKTHVFEVFIDARGQKPLSSKDIPFPSLRAALLAAGDDIPEIGEDYSLMSPPEMQGRIAFGAIPYLMHDKPFVQGITASAEIGRKIAHSVIGDIRRKRRRLSYWADEPRARRLQADALIG